MAQRKLRKMKQPLKGMKFDGQKPRWSLFPTRVIQAIIGVLEYGAKKYAPENWRLVPEARKRYYDAAMRHTHDWWLGEDIDPESGHHHLAHALCCLVFLLALDLEAQSERSKRKSGQTRKQ